MKKTLVIMLALFLAIPAISYAGSATSRWDLTIGGNIKFDAGWADQSGANSSDMWAAGNPDREPASNNPKIFDKYGTQLWGAGETGLNFFIKGPDAWGAKTHAFILGDFTGIWGSYQGGPPAAYNTFNLLIAEMAFDWENTTLTMGTGGSFWGMIPTFSLSTAWNGTGFGVKGAAPVAPQITVVQRFTKNWSAGFGIMTPWNSVNQLATPAGGTNEQSFNDFRNPLPAFEGKVAYTSDSCGKVGPWQLLVEADGFYGQQRFIGDTAPFSHKDVDEWYADFKFLIPIIPEHNGNKTHALYADAEIYWAQGAGGGGNWMANSGPPWISNDYQRAAMNDVHAPTMWGFIAHSQFYFTDAVSINGFYMYAKVNASEALKNSQAVDADLQGGIDKGYQIIGNLMYDVNPAVRFVLEWDYTNVHYVPVSPLWHSDGTQNVYKFSAYYFF